MTETTTTTDSSVPPPVPSDRSDPSEAPSTGKQPRATTVRIAGVVAGAALLVGLGAGTGLGFALDGDRVPGGGNGQLPPEGIGPPSDRSGPGADAEQRPGSDQRPGGDQRPEGGPPAPKDDADSSEPSGSADATS